MRASQFMLGNHKGWAEEVCTAARCFPPQLPKHPSLLRVIDPYDGILIKRPLKFDYWCC